VVYKPSKTEVNRQEKTIARSVGVWGVGTDVAKHILFGWLQGDANADVPVDHRRIRFPGGDGGEWNPAQPDVGQLPPEYYAMLTVEYYDLSAKRWLCPKGKRNEAWDTLVYAYWAALASFKLDMIRPHEWDALEASLEPSSDDLFAAPQANDSRETPNEAPPRSTDTPASSEKASPYHMPVVPNARAMRGNRNAGVK
jgi:phage terminase large subunit GpA-like protein